MNQFVQRLANYLANEVLVKGLAESRTFQRFALRTHNSIEELKGQGTQHLNATLDELSKATSQQATSAASSSGPPRPPLRGIPGFFSAFAKEVRKDLGLGK